MAAELVALNVDVLVSSGNAAAPYAKDATATIPVVAMLISDPLGAKLVTSIARPGGNVTGLSLFASELIGKRLQLLKEALPGVSRVAQLVNPLAQISRLYVDLTQTAADKLGLYELEPAFTAMASAEMQAVLTNSDGLAYAQRELIGQLALKNRLAAAVYMREVLVPGTFLSYGPDALEICRRAAVYVDRILKGEKPGELPVEQPTKLQFVINTKTADALGIAIPALLLSQADEVISS